MTSYIVLFTFFGLLIGYLAGRFLRRDPWHKHVQNEINANVIREPYGAIMTGIGHIQNLEDVGKVKYHLEQIGMPWEVYTKIVSDSIMKEFEIHKEKVPVLAVRPGPPPGQGSGMPRKKRKSKGK